MKNKIIIAMFAWLSFLISNLSYAAIGSVTMTFCQEGTGKNGKSLIVELNQNRKQEICMAFTNQSNQKINLNIGFVDGTITNDGDQKKACKNEGEKEIFWQFVTWYQNIFEIPANSTIIKKATIEFPDSYAGIVNGCITYSESNTQDIQHNEDGKMFSIKVRKAHFIDAIISWEVKMGLFLKSFSWNAFARHSLSREPKLYSYRDPATSELIAIMEVVNSGSIPYTLSISGHLWNRFGYQHNIIDTSRQIVAGDTLQLKYKIDTIPRYYGFFDYSFVLAYEPAAGVIDGKTLSESKNIKEYIITTTVFIFPRRFWWLAGFIILIKFSFWLYLKKKLIKKTNKTNQNQ